MQQVTQTKLLAKWSNTIRCVDFTQADFPITFMHIYFVLSPPCVTQTKRLGTLMILKGLMGDQQWRGSLEAGHIMTRDQEAMAAAGSRSARGAGC